MPFVCFHPAGYIYIYFLALNVGHATMCVGSVLGNASTAAFSPVEYEGSLNTLIVTSL